MKHLIAAAIIAASPLAALAGNLTFEPESDPEIIEPDQELEAPLQPMGGARAQYIIPLLAVLAIGLAISHGGDDDDDEGRSKPAPKPDPDPDPKPCHHGGRGGC